jgi:hypothetical protein
MMKRERVPLFLVTVLGVATLAVVAYMLAVGRGRAGGENPTPFPTAGATVTISSQEPVEVTVSELTANPGLYEGATLHVTGRYRRQPLLVCDADPHPSPATWGLAEEGLTALASGMDQQLRSLLPEDLTMTVEGRWRRWQRLVGCGKSAQAADFYYLEVGRVLSPSPLTMVTLTPGPGQEATEIAEIPSPITPTLTLSPTLSVTEEATPTLALTPTATVELPAIPTRAATIPAGVTPTVAGTAVSPTALPTPTSPLGGTATTRTPTVTGTPPTATPGTPGTPGTMTPTVTGTPPTTTPTTGPGNTNDQGDFLFDLNYFVAVEHLAANQTDSWSSVIYNDETFVIQVIAPTPADPVLSVIRDDQVIINRQNTAAAGNVETVQLSGSSEDGETFEIVIETADRSATDYSLVVHDQEPENDYQRAIRGFLTSGSPQNNITLPANTEHLWYFVGNAGNTLSLTVSPGSANDDPFPALIGPETDEDLGSMQDMGDGEDDTLTGFMLPATGLYAIFIGDNNDYEGFTYTLTLTITQ